MVVTTKRTCLHTPVRAMESFKRVAAVGKGCPIEIRQRGNTCLPVIEDSSLERTHTRSTYLAFSFTAARRGHINTISVVSVLWCYVAIRKE